MTARTINRPMLTLLTALAMLVGLIATAPAANAAVACGDTVTTDVVLDADLVCSGTHGIIVGAPGIAIDLNGFTIRNTGGGTVHGVTSNGFDDIRVGNGTIRGFYHNVHLENGSGLRAFDLVLRAGGGTGLLFHNVSDSSATNIDARSFPDAGVDVSASTNVLLDGITARRAAWGVFMVNSFATTVTNSDLRRNHFGAYAYGGNGNTVRDSVIRNNLSAGVVSEDATKTNLVSLDVRRNPTGIIFTVGSEGGAVLDSVVTRNGVGIKLGDFGYDANNVRVLRNTIRNNDGAGVFVEQVASFSQPHRIEDNRVNNNGHGAGSNPDDGIHVNAPAGAVELGDNRANSNADYGIYAPGQTDAGGNNASGNGNPAQCVGVSC